jgi:microcystin-dependent protein
VRTSALEFLCTFYTTLFDDTQSSTQDLGQDLDELVDAVNASGVLKALAEFAADPTALQDGHWPMHWHLTVGSAAAQQRITCKPYDILVNVLVGAIDANAADAAGTAKYAADMNTAEPCCDLY